MENFERSFFSIEGQEPNRIFHYHGFICHREETEDGKVWAAIELVSCFDYFDELLETGLVSFIQNTPEMCQQYQYDMDNVEVIEYIDTYYNGDKGQYIDIESINTSTPNGHYWIYDNQVNN